MDLTFIMLVLLVLILTVSGLIWIARMILAKRARAVGYDSIGTYLHAIPTTDAQKSDAADLALKGAMLTILGVLFTPLIIVGLIPLYYGARKVTLTLMDLGLTDSSPSQ